MKPKRKAADDLQIRARAEAQLARQPPAAAASRPDADLLLELQVHQVELEMQNETLRQAQHELEDSRDRYLDLYDFAPVGYLTLRADGLIEAANLTAATLLGIDRKHLLLRRFTALVGADDRSRWVGLFMKVMQRDGKGALEVALQRGDEAVFQARLDCVADAGGTALRVALTDVTERELTLQHLQQLLAERGPLLASQQAADYKMHMLLQALEQTGESIVISNLAADIEYVNEAYLIHSGYRREELIGRNARMLQSGKTPKETYAALWSALSSGRTWRGELYNRTKDGREYIEYATISPLRLADGRITHYVGAKADITERKAGEVQLRVAKEAAEAANLAKSRFLAAMSHEIRTPMNAILGMAQVLQMPGVGEAERQDYAATILGSGKTLLALLNDILDLSKVEADKVGLEAVAFEPAQVIGEAQALFAQAARGKGLRLDAGWSGAPRQYLGDAHRLRQMLGNLVSNAVKFTAQGEVRIEGREVGEAGEGEQTALLEFSVSDSGIGIASDDQVLLFQAFSQVDSSITRRYGGSGLGLSLVARLAQLMGGETGVDSEAGRGSRFWFRIRVGRVAAGPLPAPSSAAARPGRPAQFSGRVLVVEDNPDNRKVIGILLRKLGLDTLEAEDGQQALDALAGGEAADLVLMDVRMPRVDGYAATAALRQREHDSGAPRRPVVGLTAEAFAEDRRRCLAAGMDEVLTKPIAFEALQRVLGQWLPAAGSMTTALAVPPEQRAPDAARVAALVAELLPLLAHNKFDALGRFQDLQDAVAGSALAAEIEETARLLQGLDFAATLQRLRRLATTHGWDKNA